MNSPRFASNPLPASVLGILGGGQLGRMLALAARRMGLRTVVWTGGQGEPTAGVAERWIDEPFDSGDALRRFVSSVTVATIEFENIPAETLRAVAAEVPLHPSPEVVETCQNRWLEKRFLKRHGVPCAPFARVRDADELADAMRLIEGPWILKTAESGYDGRGQVRIQPGADPVQVWNDFGPVTGVLEQWIPLAGEISAIVARGADGVTEVFDPAENHHREGILDWSVVPARVSRGHVEQARETAEKLAAALDLRGVLCVEYFVTRDGRLLVNELAPRPHNSGHHTLDACATSQFEQQLRTVVGLNPGSPRLLTPVAMLNLIGDLWPVGGTPDWDPLFADGSALLHLYGKSDAGPRRKMGHANFLGTCPNDALARAVALRDRWMACAERGPHEICA